MAVHTLILALALLWQPASGFTARTRSVAFQSALISTTPTRARFSGRSSRNGEDDDGEDENEFITKEKFYRMLMNANESVERKKQTGKQKSVIHRPHDNRDQLPFLVQVMTPPDDINIYEQQILQQQRASSKKSKKKKPIDEDTDIVGETLGEFKFEKNTSAGDRIEIDEQVYLVTKAKCQYRYAGAQKFVMIRKILQVKPVQRAMQEDYLTRQFNAPSAPEME